jgi:hypothetical protein
MQGKEIEDRLPKYKWNNIKVVVVGGRGGQQQQ